MDTNTTSNTAAEVSALPPPWRALSLYNLYRLVFTGFTTVLVYSGYAPQPLGQYDPGLFSKVIAGYLVLAIIHSFVIHKRLLAFPAQVHSIILIDIAMVATLIHASGITTGIGLLLIVTVAGGSLLLPGISAYFFAAVASLSLLFEQVYAQLHHSFFSTYYTYTGLLGAAFFATATLAQVLGSRARKSEALAAQRSIDIANLAELNEHIIQRMQAGIIVVDKNNHMRLINESAWHLLGLPANNNPGELKTLAPELDNQLRQWRNNSEYDTTIIRANSTTPSILPRFASLGAGDNANTLIFLEDAAATKQQAQQMKLASLGQLTASIAHEIRNPLAAISHASQLLEESPKHDSGDARLTQIIQDHTQRMNAIVENVLQISRQDRASPEVIDLRPWLEEFTAEFMRTYHVPEGDIQLSLQPEDINVRMDVNYLRQVLWNLCQNGLRYSKNYPDSPKMELLAGIDDVQATPFLDVIDHGNGIPPSNINEIFDPFFTTDAQGTGLGLYIARDLCESNQARLDYIPDDTRGTCFRITFADPRRRQTS